VADDAGDAVDAAFADPVVEFVAEQYVREFALGVGTPLVVGDLVLEVGEVDGPRSCTLLDWVTTRDSPGVSAKHVEQVARQREVAEVVHAELRLEPVDRLRPGDGHHAGVVTEDA